MTTTNYTRLARVLESLGYTDENDESKQIKDAVTEVFHTLDAFDLSDEGRTAVADLTRELLVTLGAETADTSRAQWTEFVLGVTRPGDTVRVRADAYEGPGARHNRLVGTLTAVRGGRALVQYTGRSDGVGHSHDPEKLEVLVQS